MERPLCLGLGYLLDARLCLGAGGLMGPFLGCRSNAFLIWACVQGSLFLILATAGEILTLENRAAVVHLARFLLLVAFLRREG